MLKTTSEFNRVYRMGRSIANKFLVLYYLPNENNNIRVGLSISKKVGKSVVRNRIRRLIKENIRLNVQNIKEGYDIIIIARVMSSKCSYEDINWALNNLFKRAKILKEM
jgi:ribonuclease P protein component